ncbi:MAG TPA: AAA family ATPase [Armatimonadota bacterium]|nr:AAA family ATPase [Armatimonadota bacterium]HOM80239.1 AAA family ATPase [Armatimonadota bacterium]HPO72142.1 AAA family ATPase [Armatimonadota bacterium]HPT99612.1 AAA family ATPase [Armatimonadota bacterium]
MAEEKWRVPPERLAWRCDPDTFGFETTEDIEPLKGIAGQERAVESIAFGIDIDAPGYNLFLVGAPGTGRWHAVRTQIEERARTEPRPPDWCYVHNFDNPDEPVALCLPAGGGEEFAAAMDNLIALSQEEIPKAFQSDGYEELKSQLIREHNERRDRLIEELQAKAREAGFVIQMTPAGMVTIPLVNGQPITPEQYEELPEEQKEEIEERGKELPGQIEQTFRQARNIEREALEKSRELDQSVARQAVSQLFDAVREKYRGNEKIERFLNAAQNDIAEHVDEFRNGREHLPSDSPPALAVAANMAEMQREETLNRYRVNVLVNNAHTEGAPVVAEEHPTYYNLVGRIDFRVRFGVMVTDPRMIKAGALHRANGGYLIVDLIDVLSNPLSWDGLKRTLRTNEVRIENLGEQMGIIPTASLRPEPIPVQLKVVLIGPPFLYYLLHALDKDFGRLFKVKVDFDTEMPRNEHHLAQYTALVAALTRKEGMKPFSKGAMARAVEHAARTREHQEKLATSYRVAEDLVSEASFWAGKAGHDVVMAEDVTKALEEREYRSRMLEEKIREWIEEGTLMIDTTGAVVGQVNGLSVSALGDYVFGRPSRITGRTFLGRGGVVNIEREVKMGGRIHNKGVLILAGYLGGRYAREVPLALSATLTFEQLYEDVEGDSASAAELYALLSSLADVPIRQGIAVTGSVNQRGEIQPIGGATHKIEGFFHVCKVRGLTGEQGVIIPEQNVRNLMLKDEVIEAVKEGKFHIWAVRHIDEGIEILTGMPAGRQYPDGSFEEGSINDRVLWRLRHFAETLKEFGVQPGPEKEAEEALAGVAETLEETDDPSEEGGR